MPEEEAPKNEAPAEEEKSQKKGVSPIGIIVVVLLLGSAAAGVFFFVKRSNQEPAQETRIQQEYAEVDLGQVSYNLPLGSGGLGINRTFMCNPVLILNHKIEDVGTIQAEVERRKSFLRGLVLEIISQKPANYFRPINRKALEDLARLLTDQLNEWLGPTKIGQLVVERVIFTEFQIPGN